MDLHCPLQGQNLLILLNDKVWVSKPKKRGFFLPFTQPSVTMLRDRFGRLSQHLPS
jgi:hypothetical protein